MNGLNDEPINKPADDPKGDHHTNDSIEIQLAKLNIDWLASIDKSLKSIKSSLTFFVVLAVIGIILGILATCGSMILK